MVGGGEVSFNVEGLTQRLPEPENKQGAPVRDNVIQEAMFGEDMFEEEFGEFQGIVGGVAGNEGGLFGELADDNKNGIVPF